MRITIVVPFVNLTGGIRVMFDYANHLHARGHAVKIVYPAWPYRFQLSRRQQYQEFRKECREGAGVRWFRLTCPLVRVPLIANRFLPEADIVIATSWPTVYDVGRLAPSRGRKVHIVFHDESDSGAAERVRGTYALPFHRIAFSRLIQRSTEECFGCRVQDVVPNGVDTSIFFPDGERGRRTVLMLYHPQARKGAADGLAALARVRERVPEADVRLCGTVEPASLPPWVSFTFHPPDAELRRLYSGAAAFLYPSRYEGFGLPPLEAMACGCPVVTTSVGAVPEFAADGENAFVVQPGAVDAMAARMCELLQDGPLADRFANEGLQVAAWYSLRNVAPMFEAALTRVLQ